MKKQASSTDIPITQIYGKEKKKLEDKGIHFVLPVPPLKNIQTALYTSRKRTNFKNVESVEIPEQLSSYLLAEYLNGSCRISVFCSNEGRKLLGEAEEFFVDGTFQSCPQPFEQLFTIHGDLGASSSETKVVPLVYALMSDKKQESYAALFAMIKSQIPDWTPKKIHLDFEIAIANALMNIFPEVILKKCFAHLSKAIWKNSKVKLKIKEKIEKRIVGLCKGLALMPENLIENGIDYIKNESTSSLKITKFLKYMERTWWKNKDYRSSWCVYGERHRTNNVVESWHSQLNKNVKKRSPVSILRLINAIMDMESERTSDASRRRKEELDRDDFILKCQLQVIHGDITVGHFLEKLR